MDEAAEGGGVKEREIGWADRIQGTGQSQQLDALAHVYKGRLQIRCLVRRQLLRGSLFDYKYLRI